MYKSQANATDTVKGQSETAWKPKNKDAENTSTDTPTSDSQEHAQTSLVKSTSTNFRNQHKASTLNLIDSAQGNQATNAVTSKVKRKEKEDIQTPTSNKFQISEISASEIEYPHPK